MGKDPNFIDKRAAEAIEAQGQKILTQEEIDNLVKNLTLGQAAQNNDEPSPLPEEDQVNEKDGTSLGENGGVAYAVRSRSPKVCPASVLPIQIFTLGSAGPDSLPHHRVRFVEFPPLNANGPSSEVALMKSAVGITPRHGSAPADVAKPKMKPSDLKAKE